MNTDVASLRQLRRELWELIRFWRYDCFFGDSKGVPYDKVNSYGFTQNVKHAMSYWKGWLKTKKECAENKFEARYQPSNSDGKSTAAVHIAPDEGEYQYVDYTLFNTSNGSYDLMCMLESEHSCKLTETAKDFPKLCKANSPIKVMVYCVDYIYKIPPIQSFNEKIRYFQDTMNEYLATGSINREDTEEWLFIGYPYWDEGKWPTKPNDDCVKIHAFSLPCDGQVVLRAPDWDIWEKNQKMEDWLWKQHGG
ncbi:MAG: hypothetical protein QM703_21805 [Gemmatales bacterium]